MTRTDDNIVQRVWSLCHILRGDGIGYNQYISELTYLLFLKIAEETSSEAMLPVGSRWRDLSGYKKSNILPFYQEMLTRLGAHAESKLVREIFAFPTTVFSHSENLRAVINGISKIDWHILSKDRIGDIYEGLLAKNSQDARSGAGQYFTPRALVDSIINLVQPALGEVIQDPSVGSGGFFISADHYMRKKFSSHEYINNRPKYVGVEIEKSTYRLCLMNIFLHDLDARVILGDALTEDARDLEPADLIIANPPFGAKGGGRRKNRDDFDVQTTNKQLAFLQHIYAGLKIGGRAAVILPDNVLFEDGAGRRIRQRLMEVCNLHTILRLPQGIFYSPGVQTNVLFFEKIEPNVSSTKAISFYDMRTGAPRYGRKRPLVREDFREFEFVYKARPEPSEVPSGRWQTYSRKQIAERDDDLNVKWLAEEYHEAEPDTADPIILITTIAEGLRAALEEADSLAEYMVALSATYEGDS